MKANLILMIKWVNSHDIRLYSHIIILIIWQPHSNYLQPYSHDFSFPWYLLNSQVQTTLWHFMTSVWLKNFNLYSCDFVTFFLVFFSQKSLIFFFNVAMNRGMLKKRQKWNTEESFGVFFISERWSHQVFILFQLQCDPIL